MTEPMVMDVSQDWAIACDVQRRFMSPGASVIGALSYGASCRQLHALGGDCYDFLPLSAGRLAFAIGDASGKGLPAALMIANVQSSLRTAALFAAEHPVEVVGAVNRQLHTSSSDDRFATLFYGVLDPASRVLRYVNAGHNSPLVIRCDGSFARLDVSGLPLGILPDSTYEESTFRLRPGDAVVAYTDGVTESLNEFGEEWGEDGLRRAVVESKARSADEMVDQIFKSLDEFTRGRLTDDATAMVLLVP